MSILTDILAKAAANAAPVAAPAEPVAAAPVVAPAAPEAPVVPEVAPARPIFSDEAAAPVAEETPEEVPAEEEAPSEETPEEDTTDGTLIDKIGGVIEEFGEVLSDTFGDAKRDLEVDNETVNEGTSQEKPKWVEDAFGKNN